MKKNVRRKEKGSALLFTIGILALAMIMAMSFAFSSRTSRQVAKVNADQVKARLYAESGLDRVLAFINYGYNKNSTNYYLPNISTLEYRKYQFSSTPWVASRYYFNNGSGNTKADYSQSYLVSVVKNKNNWIASTDATPTFTVQDETAKKLLGVGEPSSLLPMLEYADVCTKHFGFHDFVSNGVNIDGRTAWIVIEEANKIDVNQALSLERFDGASSSIYNCPFFINADLHMVVDKDKGRPSSLFGLEFDRTKDYYHNVLNIFPISENVTETNTVRQGLSMAELQLDGAFLDKLPSFTRNNVKASVPWQSYRQLKNCNDSGTNDLISEDNLKKYTFFSDYDIEAYWVNNVSKERQCFDLSGFEWRASTDSYYDSDGRPDATNENNVTGWSSRKRADGKDYEDASLLVDKLTIATSRPAFFSDYDTGTIATAIPKQNNPSATNYTYDTYFGIPYLGSSTDFEKKQVAANMVDFCDGDFYATVDKSFYPFDSNKDTILSSSDWTSYWGNEAVPYFEEFAIKFTLVKSAPLEAPDTDKCKVSMTFEPQLDMFQVNSYEGTNYYPAGKAAVRMYGSATLMKNGVELLKIVDGEFKEMEWTYEAGTSNTPSKTVLTTTTGTKSSEKIESGLQTVLLTDEVKIVYNIDRIVMLSFEETEKRYYDMAIADGAVSGEINVMSADATGTDYVCSWQVKDIRLNHKKDQWEITTEVSTGVKGFEASGTSNIASSRGDYSTLAAEVEKHDNEEYGDMTFEEANKTFSTAFIPNRPFKNIWELGAIHRGQAFRTLSLLNYDKAICNQVKIGPFKQVRGKFNCNTRNLAAWKELLKNVDYTKGYNEIANDETGFSFPAETDINDIAMSRDRSESANVFIKLNTYMPVKNDREEEALFGRTVGLLSTRNDKYSILVAAQALQELPDVPVDSVANFDAVKSTLINPIVYSNKDDTKMAYSLLATQKILAHVSYDTWRKKAKVMQIYYVEE